MEATEKSVTSGVINDPILAGPLAGFFATANSKSISIAPERPYPGWVMISFTDEADNIGLHDQLFYVPKALFDAAIDHYRKPKD